MMKSAAPDAGDKIGEEWLYAQCKDLLANNAPVLHFYTLGKPMVVYNVLKRLF
jgi:methylenetetrahydrofolate reductase (NADPH)